MEWSWYHKTQARQAKQNAVESKLKSRAECLFIWRRHLTRASHPPAVFKHLILISTDKGTSTLRRSLGLSVVYCNTTLESRKRHFTYRLIAVHGALLRASSPREAHISASPAEVYRQSVVVEGPRASARNTRGIPTITHGWAALEETDRFLEFYYFFAHTT